EGSGRSSTPPAGWEALAHHRPQPGGYTDPVRLLEAAQKAFLRLGGRIERKEVTGLSEGWVETASRRLPARWVVIACGAWAGRFGLEIHPLKGEALRLAAPPPPGPVFVGEGYALPRNGQTYLGATQRETWRPGVEPEGLAWLERYRAEAFPPLRGAPILESYWGYRPAGRLTVGPVAPGVLAAVGHRRNGILLAPATARRVAEMVLDLWKTPR
ncbi:NAD(P)/FAD-dependent oxidoreductase, partial [Meiothermus taiwanensis]|uniref:NAD(P)/FAD-dependent oxidoreductase n=1 Tax=Meiothermus taiwanensis TaxID=172827 RepID=UPI0007B4C528